MNFQWGEEEHKIYIAVRKSTDKGLRMLLWQHNTFHSHYLAQTDSPSFSGEDGLCQAFFQLSLCKERSNHPWKGKTNHNSLNRGFDTL